MRFAKRKVKARFSLRRSGALNVGFVPTIDCAVLIAAAELGLFRKYDLNVRLSREVGWATIREKLLHEELDAAAAHASMLFSIYCGIGVVRRSCLTGLLLGFNGSAITLSNELWCAGVRDAESLGAHVRDQRQRRPLTFGVVLGLSSQNYNLRKWLRSGGIDPDRDVRIIVIPSALVYESYREGYLDGYCVAEPWNSAAALSGSGWVATTTGEVEPEHPEKVLLVLQDFAEQREEEHLRLIASLIEASRFCDDPAHRREFARMLARPEYFDVSEKLLENALNGPFYTGKERRDVDDLVVFDARRAGRPSRAKGRWVFDMVRSLDAAPADGALRPEIITKVFREDIFDRALQLQEAANPPVAPPFFPPPAPRLHGVAGRPLTPVIRKPVTAMPVETRNPFGAGPTTRPDPRKHSASNTLRRETLKPTP